MLILIKNYNHTLIEQTKINPQETLEFVMKRQMQTFSSNLYLPINSIEECKCLLCLSSFECTIFVFNIIDESNSFSISRPSYWTPEGGEEHINKLNELLDLRSENDIELHVKDVEKRGNLIEIGNRDYNLAASDHFKSQMLADLERLIYRELEDMVYRMGLTYDEIVNILDVKYTAG